jgi:DegV family protein with EDD domain
MYRIFTDTSANLPAAELAGHAISVVRLGFQVEGVDDAEFFRADGEFKGRVFYSWLRAGANVTTTMVNLQTFTDAFEPALRAGEDVLYVAMSSGISGTYHASTLAAEELRARYPERTILTVDTRAASLGEGLPVLFAAQAREEGKSIKEAARTTRTFSELICQYFTVADLKYLQKGGRVSRLSAKIGSLLNIKPVLMGNELGEIVMSGKTRGMRHALAALAEKYDELAADRAARVGIAHADAPEEAEELAQLLRGKGLTGEILSVCYEPVTGAHVGPGAVALFFSGIHR